MSSVIRKAVATLYPKVFHIQPIENPHGDKLETMIK